MLSRLYVILFAITVVGALLVDRPLVDEILQAIIAVGIIITAYQAMMAKQRSVVNSEKLDAIHDLTNTQSIKLNDLTAKSSHAEGVLEGRAQVQSEQADEQRNAGGDDAAEGSIQRP